MKHDELATPERRAGHELRNLRIARGWSQEEVARRLDACGYDWHQTMIAKVEAAQRPLRLNEAVDMAALYGVPLATLLGDELESAKQATIRALELDVFERNRAVEDARALFDSAVSRLAAAMRGEPK